MPHSELILAIVVAFVIAGVVKGVIGFGLPSVVLALLAAAVGLNEAMVLLLVPCFVTNLWQALSGSNLVYVIKRFWTLLVGIVLISWVGARWHATTDSRWLISLLGGLLCAYALLGLVTHRIPSPGRHETVLSPIMGAISGILNGLTDSFVVPGVLYLQALGLARDTLIQALGVLFITSTIALGVSLRGNGLLSAEYALLSVMGVVPALLGMAACGLPEYRDDHGVRTVHLAREMPAAENDFDDLEVRIGINSGPVLASIIRQSRIAFDLWGETVNMASRMESHGSAGRVQVTETTYALVSKEFDFDEAREIQVKGKGLVKAYQLSALA